MFKLSQIALAIALTSSLGFSQKLVSVSCDKGSEVVVTYDQPDGKPGRIKIKHDSNEDGKVEVTVPKGSTNIKVSKYSDGEFITYDV